MLSTSGTRLRLWFNLDAVYARTTRSTCWMLDAARCTLLRTDKSDALMRTTEAQLHNFPPAKIYIPGYLHITMKLSALSYVLLLATGTTVVAQEPCVSETGNYTVVLDLFASELGAWRDHPNPNHKMLNYLTESYWMTIGSFPKR